MATAWTTPKAPVVVSRRALLFGGGVLLLAACGKKGEPRAPKDLPQTGRRPPSEPIPALAPTPAPAHDS